MRNAQKLIKDVNEKIEKWNERSCFTIKGVKNLSRSDMDTLILYAEHYIMSGGNNFSGLMEPLGNIKEVLNKYDITVKDYWF